MSPEIYRFVMTSCGHSRYCLYCYLRRVGGLITQGETRSEVVAENFFAGDLAGRSNDQAGKEGML